MKRQNSNPCPDCDEELEFEFSSGNYNCSKCDGPKDVLTPEEKIKRKQIDEERKQQEKIAEERKQQEKIAEERKQQEKIAKERKQQEKRERYPINVNIVRELKVPRVSNRDTKLVTVHHMSSVQNLESIIQHGLLSTSKLNEMSIEYPCISNKQIMNRRKNKFLQPGENLLNWCPTYFRLVNPMWKRIYCSGIGTKNLVMLKLKVNVNQPECFVTDINAAISNTPPTFYEGHYISEGTLQTIQHNARTNVVNESTKPSRQAECLVKDRIPHNSIEEVMVPRREMVYEIKNKINTEIPIIFNSALC